MLWFAAREWFRFYQVESCRCCFSGLGWGRQIFSTDPIKKRTWCKKDSVEMDRLFSGAKYCVVRNGLRLVSQLSQQGIDVGSFTRFVSLQDDDIVFFQQCFGCFGVESEPLRCFARPSPISGEVHQHRMPFCQMTIECFTAVFLVVQLVSR